MIIFSKNGYKPHCLKLLHFNKYLHISYLLCFIWLDDTISKFQKFGTLLHYTRINVFEGNFYSFYFIVNIKKVYVFTFFSHFANFCEGHTKTTTNSDRWRRKRSVSYFQYSKLYRKFSQYLEASTKDPNQTKLVIDSTNHTNFYIDGQIEYLNVITLTVIDTAIGKINGAECMKTIFKIYFISKNWYFRITELGEDIY